MLPRHSRITATSKKGGVIQGALCGRKMVVNVSAGLDKENFGGEDGDKVG
jgi:hypothetical protein